LEWPWDNKNFEQKVFINLVIIANS